MGILSSLKGDHPDTVGKTTSSTYPRPDMNTDTYLPPPGPPPHHHATPQNDHKGYAPPLRPPPADEEYTPPSGPAPLHTHRDIPPALSKPPPYHDWTVIPDTALLPPPPSLGHDKSPSGNADASDADRAHDWCKAYPLIRPHQPTYDQHAAVGNGDVRLIKPPEYRGDLLMPGTGAWKGFTKPSSKDSCLLSSLPLYFAFADAPRPTSKTIYYEIKVNNFGDARGDDESSIALGYCAMPYPTWRLPGWERGSLAIHGDDGRKYVNDTWGGKDFTSPFRVGDTLGLGMTFSLPNNPPQYGASQQKSIPMKTDIFLTRNGEKGETWNLHEELDANNDLGVDGLDGQFDLYAAVGTFGRVDFDVFFNRQDWLWRPR